MPVPDGSPRLFLITPGYPRLILEMMQIIMIYVKKSQATFIYFDKN